MQEQARRQILNAIRLGQSEARKIPPKAIGLPKNFAFPTFATEAEKHGFSIGLNGTRGTDNHLINRALSLASPFYQAFSPEFYFNNNTIIAN